MWIKGTPAHNKINLDAETIQKLCDLFKEGYSIPNLMREFKLSRKTATRFLKNALGEEYTAFAKKIMGNCGKKSAYKRTGPRGPHSNEWNAKIGASNTGKKRSEETRQKISEANKRQWANDAIVSSRREGYRAEKHREAMKKAAQTKRERGYYKIHGVRHSEWMLKNAPNKGKHCSDETRQRMSESKKAYYANGGVPYWSGKKRSSTEIERMRECTRKMWEEGKFDYGQNGIFSSKLELSVYEELKKLDSETQHNSVRLTSAEGTSYVFDIYVPSLNLLIEVNGDYWHLNPRTYDIDHFDSSRNVSAADVWKRDTDKTQLAISSGYRVQTIWESDIKVQGVSNVIKSLLERCT